jgi:cell division protein FtsB
MKKVIPFLKNKYLISSVAVLLYILILHDTDIYALHKRGERVDELKSEIVNKEAEIESLKLSLYDLDDPRSLEKYAREHHYFKKSDEDLFIFSFE